MVFLMIDECLWPVLEVILQLNCFLRLKWAFKGVLVCMQDNFPIHISVCTIGFLLSSRAFKWLPSQRTPKWFSRPQTISIEIPAAVNILKSSELSRCHYISAVVRWNSLPIWRGRAMQSNGFPFARKLPSNGFRRCEFSFRRTGNMCCRSLFYLN